MAVTVRTETHFQSGESLIEVSLVQSIQIGTSIFSALNPTIGVLEFQDAGVVFDMTSGSPEARHRIFVPYSNIKAITQTVS